MCDFITPDGYKSTADVRAGSCHDNTEPSCRNKDEDGICQGPFTTDGSIRTIAYAAVAQSDKDEGSFTQTYCARADVYADVFDTGYESSVAHAKAIHKQKKEKLLTLEIFFFSLSLHSL